MRIIGRASTCSSRRALRVNARRDDVFFVWVGAHEQIRVRDGPRASWTRAGSTARFLFPDRRGTRSSSLPAPTSYLMTSREDPFPSVVLQALDAGLPVVGFEGAGGFVELLSRGCGVLVPFWRHRRDGGRRAATARLARRSATTSAAGREILAREFSFLNYARVLVELVSARRPKVSVVVPNYNYARHLPARLKSIVNQTYPPHEIIFLDDCSSDDSVDVASAHSARVGLVLSHHHQRDQPGHATASGCGDYARRPAICLDRRG